MKVLVVMGSPRKKETYGVVKQLEALITAKQPEAFEYCFLQEEKLSDCIGCHACIERDEAKCHQSSKISAIKERIKTADVIILASPVYNDHVTALMKKWFDYMTYLWHRPELFGKKFVLMASGGGMFKAQFDYMKKNVASWGGEVIGSCGVAHFDSLTPKYQEKAKKSIQALADKLLQLETYESFPRPTLGQLIWFNMWKMNAIAAKSGLPKDFKYWTEKGWMDSDYYYPTTINPFKRLATKAISALMKSFMHKVYIGY